MDFAWIAYVESEVQTRKTHLKIQVWIDARDKSCIVEPSLV